MRVIDVFWDPAAKGLINFTDVSKVYGLSKRRQMFTSRHAVTSLKT
jgi:hypothetical protein